MTTAGDDGQGSVPRDRPTLAPDDKGGPVRDGDTPEDVANDETAEGSRELVRQGVVPAPKIAETIKRAKLAGRAYKSLLHSGLLAQTGSLNELIGGSAYRSVLEGSALMRRSGLAEGLARLTADRAAFSLASGLRAADFLTPDIGKVMADTQGSGIAKSALATVGESLRGFKAADLGLTTPIAGLVGGLGPNVDVPGFHAALRQSQAFRDNFNKLTAPEFARTRSLAMQQLVATSGIADLIGRDKMVASWRQTLLSEATARSLLGTMAIPETGASLLRDIVSANTATARVVGRYVELNKASVLAPPISARPTRELRSFLAGMPVAPSLDELIFAGRASKSVAGIVAADLLVVDSTIEDEAGELLDAEIVEPWLTGPEAVRDLLFARLHAIDPQIPDLLRGAWDQVERDGPAATSMASHAVQEAIDRTLRALAPDELVLQLDAAGLIPKNSVHERNGERQPTRAGRVAAALHTRRPGETKLIAAQTKAIAASVTYLTQNLQRGKHASKGTIGLVRTWLVSVEAIFTQLLYEPGDG